MSKIIDEYFENCAYVEMDKEELIILEESIREDEKKNTKTPSYINPVINILREKNTELEEVIDVNKLLIDSNRQEIKDLEEIIETQKESIENLFSKLMDKESKILDLEKQLQYQKDANKWKKEYIALLDEILLKAL